MGITQFCLDRSVLIKISKKYRKLGLVPQGYNYPELLLSPELPERMSQLNERKLSFEIHKQIHDL